MICAALATYVGLGLLALCQRAHWRQICAHEGGEGPPPYARRRGRWLGVLALLVGFVAALVAQGPSFGALLFGLLGPASGVAVAFTLTYRPHWLRPLSWAVQTTPKR